MRVGRICLNAPHHGLKVFNERQVLRNLLQLDNRKPRIYGEEAVRQVRLLREIESVPRQRADSSAQQPNHMIGDKAPPELVSLVTQSTLSTGQLQQWMDSNLSGTPQVSQRDKIHKELLLIIGHCSANSLRTVMQFLVKYWESGLQNQRPLIRETRAQAESLLQRALQVHPATFYLRTDRNTVVEQTGIPDIERFASFVRSLFVYMDIDIPEPGQPLDGVQDTYMQLCLRCSSFEHASSLLKRHLADNYSVSSLAAEELVAAVERRGRAHQSTPELQEWRELLIESESNTPVTAKFLLNCADSLEKFQTVLTILSRSVKSKQIYEQCQLEMIDSLARIAPDNLHAHTFGLIDRFEREGAATTKPALERSMELMATNESATKILRERLGLLS